MVHFYFLSVFYLVQYRKTLASPVLDKDNKLITPDYPFEVQFCYNICVSQDIFEVPSQKKTLIKIDK